MEKNIERRVELTGKLIVMSEALMKEGFENDDKQIISVGGLLLLIANLIMNESEMEEFNKITNMFTSSKILAMFEERGVDITKYLLPSGDDNNSFDSIMGKIRKDVENHFKNKGDKGEGDE